MKKIKQLSFVLFIFSVLAILYFGTSVYAQEGIVCEEGQFDVSLTCNPTSGTCCNQCDSGAACVAGDPNTIPCCEVVTPSSNGEPGSSGSSDTATFDPNTGLGSQAPKNNVIRNPKGSVLRKPTGKITRNPGGTITSKPTSGITRNPRGSNGSTSIPNIQGIEDRANRRPQSRTSTPLFIPPSGTQPKARDPEGGISCENIRAEIRNRVHDIKDTLERYFVYGNSTVLRGLDELCSRKVGCLKFEIEEGDLGIVRDEAREWAREILEYIDDHCL